MHAKQPFDSITAQFDTACKNTGSGIFADTSSLWQDVFSQRSNFPSADDFTRMLAPNSPFAAGIGMGRPMDLATYRARYEDWVSRYGPSVDAADLKRWPEPAVGTPTVLEHQGYRASVIYLKNFALAKVIEDAVARHHARGRDLKVLEIGAGYGGVAEILLRKGIAASFTDVDLPENLFLAAQFVQAAFPEASGAVINRAAPQDGKAAQLRFLLPNDLPLLDDEEFDLAVNTVSLGEMPAATAQAYVAWISTHVAPDGLFISHNAHAVHDLGEVVQRQSAYGFERFRLLEMRPQPSPVGLRHQVHAVMTATRRREGDKPFDAALVDAFAGIMNLGITAELAGPLRIFAGPLGAAEQRFVEIIRHVYAAQDVSQKYAAAATRLGDPACDAALEYIQGALALPVVPATAHKHFANYLPVATSPLAICCAVSALRHILGSNMDPTLAAAIAQALAKVPPHLARQIEGYGIGPVLKRFILNLDLTR